VFKYLVFEAIAALVGVVALISLIIHLLRWPGARFLKEKGIYIPVILFTLAFFTGLIANRTYPPDQIH